MAEPVLSEVFERAVEFLDPRFGVETLYLFGSQAQGTARPDSDLDLAGLFSRRPTPLARIEAAADLAALLGRDVDLIDLDEASPILARQVLKYGRLLVDRNVQRRIALIVKTVSMYEDLKIWRREAERALLGRFALERS